MKPRNLFYHALLALHTVLLLVVVSFTWYDNRRATTSTRRALSGFESRLDALAAQVDSSLSGPPRVRSSRDSSQVDSSLSAPPRVRSPADDWERVPPRVLGSGVSGRWAYVDVCYADGATRRHYVRTNSTPREVKSFVRSLATESDFHSWRFVGSDSSQDGT